MFGKALRTVCVCSYMSLAMTLLATAQPYDGVSDVQVVASAPGQLVISMRYVYYTGNGDNVSISAIPLNMNNMELYMVGCVAWPVHSGWGRAYLLLNYAGGGSIGSSAMRIFMQRDEGSRGRVRILTIDWPMTKTWSSQIDSISGAMRTLSQSARELRGEATYTLSSSHTAPAFLQAQPLGVGTIAPGFTYAPSGPLSSGTSRSATVSTSFVGSGTSYTDGVLLVLYEGGGGSLAYSVVPRIKYWATSTRDRDRDGISDAIESSLGTNTRSRDTDDDGLEDGWELEGYRSDGYQYDDSNLPMLGASARHRDVFIEVDYLGGLTGGMSHDHQLHVDTINKAKELYGTLPISNPDGRNGLALHLLQDEMIPYDGDLGGVAGMGGFLTYFPERKRRIYHWAIAGHGGGGQAYITSNWLVFGTEGGWPYGGSWLETDKFLAFATLVHELGHNLGLLHEGRSGRRQENCKPNYPSLMNYAYDYSFNCTAFDLATTQIQFSGGSAPSISEGSLRETGNAGLGFVSGYDADYLDCNYFNVDGGNIDWNHNGVYDPGRESVDCDAFAPSCCRKDDYGNSLCGDGIRRDQRDSNDFRTVQSYTAESIRRPHFPDLALTSAERGYLYDEDVPDLIEPVCGLPAPRDGSARGWLGINPVFQLRPGMEIKHPAMRVILRPYLDQDDRIRADAPIEVSPALDGESPGE